MANRDQSTFMNLTLKKGLGAILFYILIIIAIKSYMATIPNGPCVSAGPFFIALAILLFLNLVFLAVNVVKLARGNKTNRASAAIHFLVLVATIAYLYYLEQAH